MQGSICTCRNKNDWLLFNEPFILDDRRSEINFLSPAMIRNVNRDFFYVGWFRVDFGDFFAFFLFFVFFSIIITMYIDSLVTNKLKIKVKKTRQHRTQNLQKTYTACYKFCI